MYLAQQQPSQAYHICKRLSLLTCPLAFNKRMLFLTLTFIFSFKMMEFCCELRQKAMIVHSILNKSHSDIKKRIAATEV